MKMFWVDSSVYVAAALKRDPQHQAALGLFKKCQLGQQGTNQLIVSEVATVLLLKTKKIEFVRDILHDLFFAKQALVQVQALEKQLWQASYQIFHEQSGHKLSFADCSLLAQLKAVKTKDELVTLDKALKIAAKNI